MNYSGRKDQHIKSYSVSRTKLKIIDSQDPSQSGIWAHSPIFLTDLCLSTPVFMCSMLSDLCSCCFSAWNVPFLPQPYQRQASYFCFSKYCFCIIHVRHSQCLNESYSSFQTRTSSYMTPLRHNSLPTLELISLLLLSSVGCAHLLVLISSWSAWTISHQAGYLQGLIRWLVPSGHSTSIHDYMGETEGKTGCRFSIKAYL